MSNTENRMLRLCVFTCITGDYENLNEQPVAIGSNIDFICFTNNSKIDSKTWNIIQIDDLIIGDDHTNQRLIKIIPDYIKSKYRYSMYIDNSVILEHIPFILIEDFIKSGRPIGLAYHSFRNTILDEILAISFYNLDFQNRILEQVNFYKNNYKDALFSRVFWGGLILRDHESAILDIFQKKWFSHVLRFSKRDQLSLGILINIEKLEVFIVDVDNNLSYFHSWPHSSGRKKHVNQENIEQAMLLQKEIREIIDCIYENALDDEKRSRHAETTTPYKNIHLVDGSNSEGSGGSLSFGIAEFPSALPLSSIKGELINYVNTELQGGIVLSTRPLGIPGQNLTPRLRIKANGVIQILPVNCDPEHLEAGDIFFDRISGKLKISLDGKNWSQIITENLTK